MHSIRSKRDETASKKIQFMDPTAAATKPHKSQLITVSSYGSSSIFQRLLSCENWLLAPTIQWCGENPKKSRKCWKIMGQYQRLPLNFPPLLCGWNFLKWTTTIRVMSFYHFSDSVESIVIWGSGKRHCFFSLFCFQVKCHKTDNSKKG